MVWKKFYFNYKKKNIRKAITDVSNLLFLDDLLDKSISELNSFEKLKVLLAVAIVYRPKVLLLDEAFSALDFQTRLNVVSDIYLNVANKNTIELLSSLNVKKIGLSIKPNTNVKALDEYLQYLDLILVMSVEPGFGGQKFMDSSLDKIKYLKEQKEQNGYKYIIEVDGGINQSTAALVEKAGCEAVVAGTYLFKSDNFSDAVKGLKNICVQ